MKIICIGRNYANHAKELRNPIPTQPLIFMKPATAVVKEGNPFFLPEFSKEIHHEIEVVLKISKNGRHIEEQFAHRYYEEIGLGIDFTARDLQEQLKQKGQPWEIAKAFDGSAIVGDFLPKASLDASAISFHLTKNGATVQQGNTQDLIFNFDYLIQFISKYFTLQKGDLIYTGTPEGVGAVQPADVLEGFIGSNKLLHCAVK
ncbi:MAG: fumarylacetoacetate hydrolase family protein [Saprospiraceae bacterium]|nr:fumarylacetoacetate hydrolase family protein [Saprospiraceae bacterium]MBP7699750.1 fumarylacetoacetate hydrolase family protein [Saprospiraceae bacterium]